MITKDQSDVVSVLQGLVWQDVAVECVEKPFDAPWRLREASGIASTVKSYSTN